MDHVFLSRRNIETLISKLNRKAQGEETACTIIKCDNTHPKYPQTMPYLAVTAVEYKSCSYLKDSSIVEINRIVLERLLADLDANRPSIRAIFGLTVTVLENEEYYTERASGKVYHRDEPSLS